MPGPVSFLAYAQGLGGNAGRAVANVNDGTDQGGGAAEAKEDGALTPEEVQAILKDYPAVTFNDSYQGSLLVPDRSQSATDSRVSDGVTGGAGSFIGSA